jgi:ABC-type lipoprotein export system ATPase subunit
MNLFTQLNRDGQTIIMVTHNTGIEHYFNRIVELKDGAIATDTTLKSEPVAAVG